MPQIIPLFPKKISTFVDLFGGGFNVGINVECERILYNDNCFQVSEMLRYFKSNSVSDMLNQIDTWILEYNLTKENQEGFLNFRDCYNLNKHPLMLYTLICYAFNNQIRFNLKGDYNMPFGKNRSSFNPILREKFIKFVNELHSKEIDIMSCDFRQINIQNFDTDSLFYCDPPYFNSIATYNENGGWKIEDEKTF